MNTYYPDFKVNKEHLPEVICIDEFSLLKTLMALCLSFLLTIKVRVLLIL